MASKAGAYDPTRVSFTPGPGQYQPLTSNRPSSAKYTKRAKPCPKGRELTPGPRNYNLRQASHLVSTSYRFGHEKKVRYHIHILNLFQVLEIMVLMQMLCI